MTATKPCEVCLTYGDGEQHDCGAPSRINVNGFPCCARHFADFEEEQTIESVALLEPQVAPDPSFCATCGQPSEHSTHSPGDLRSHTFKPEGAPECEAVQRFGRHDIHHGSCRGCGLFTGER